MTFSPDPLEVAIGDSVVWQNDDFMDHTARARNGAFRTGRIAAGQSSAPQILTGPINHSGIEYYCEFHSGMIGRVVATADQVRKLSTDGRPFASLAAGPPAGFAVADWDAMADLIAAAWVYDMADDFEHAVANTDGDTQDPVVLAWQRIRTKWAEISGGTEPITDRGGVMGLPRATLMTFGRLLRTEKQKVGIAVQRHPDPKREVNNGQSYDPFGKSITIFAADADDQAAYGREARYVGRAYGIESRLDLGQPVTPADIAGYKAAKAAVMPDDYHRLAAHLERGLRSYFGGAAFDRDKFVEGIWRMTTAGEWDQPEFVGWHWSKFVDAYLGVLHDGAVPDIVTLPTA
jgi:hypothetical protein